MPRTKRTTLFGALLSLGLSTASPAGNYQLAHTFQRANPEVDDAFGTAVVMEGGVIAIKSNSANGFSNFPYSSPNNGLSTTHVFEQQPGGGWDEAATLSFTPEEWAGENPFIGQELSIDNGVIAISYSEAYDAIVRDPIRFATRGPEGWSTVTNVVTPIPRPRDPNPPFARYARNYPSRIPGRVVEISGDQVIVEHTSASRAGLNGGLGVARIFERGNDGNWREQYNLAPAGIGDMTVYSVAIDGNAAALVDRGHTGHDGGVYFFEREASGDWIQAESFVATGNDFFNAVVEIDGDAAMTRNLVSGDVALYRRGMTGWELEATIANPNSTGDFRFNYGFAIEDDLLAVSVKAPMTSSTSVLGASGETLSSLEIGFNDPSQVQLYQRGLLGDWSLIETINDPEPEVGRRFGSSLALDQGRLLIGASAVSVNSMRQPPGAAFLYVLVPEPSTAILLVTCGLLPWRRKVLA